MSYTVDPGLYALGRPGPDSHVFVTASYKLSFDRLREALSGRDGWILVLDTAGINVWCAAGKGSFGTEEMIDRIETSGLSDIVSHRRLIVPQLGGPGVAAHEVKRRSGFQVVYGPVAAEDIPPFLERGLKATPAMRAKTFGTSERLALVPMEVVPALKVALPAAAVLSILAFLFSGFSIERALGPARIVWVALGTSVLAGAVLTPLFLPWLPGRAFSAKGLVVGTAAAFCALFAGAGLGVLSALSVLLSVPAIAAFLAMNFTGSSTFTSLSGVQREMGWALPLEAAGTAAGLALWVAAAVGGGW
jgi:acetyl-CoA decarbonylase/synthase complex subunit gamma